MSKYVTHKGGLILGSDNVFFCIDRPRDGLTFELPEGVPDFRDNYRAVVWPESYKWEQVNPVNVFVLTPAQQLIWTMKSQTFWETYKDTRFPIERNYWTVTGFAERWLTKNVGPKYEKWDCRTQAESSADTIFFKRRKDALAFVKMIQTMTALRKPKSED